jgi:hypothetical protein
MKKHILLIYSSLFLALASVSQSTNDIDSLKNKLASGITDDNVKLDVLLDLS